MNTILRRSVLVIIALALSAPAAAAQPDACERVRKRDKELASYSFQQLMVGLALTVQGLPHPMEGANPRPGWTPDLFEYYRELNLGLQRSLLHSEVPDVLLYHFYAKPYRATHRGGIRLDRDRIWCLIREGDTALLRRGSLSHFTGVFLVDRTRGLIYFLDQWPDRFLLKVDDEMEVGGRKIIGVRREIFLRAVIGFVTLDTPRLVYAYLKEFPPDRNEPELYLEAADALLEFGDPLSDASDRHSRYASVLLQRGHQMAREANLEELSRTYRARFDYAVLLHYYALVLAGQDASEAKPIIPLFDNSDDSFLEGNDVEDYYRLGLRAGRANDIRRAIRFFNGALALAPDHIGAHVNRANAYNHENNYPKVVEDATSALLQIDRQRRALDARMKTRDPRDRWRQKFDQRDAAELRSYRLDGLRLRARASLALHQWAQARTDALAVIEMKPKDPEWYVVAANAEDRLGMRDAAIKKLETALTLSPDAYLESAIRQVLATLRRN